MKIKKLSEFELNENEKPSFNIGDIVKIEPNSNPLVVVRNRNNRKDSSYRIIDQLSTKFYNLLLSSKFQVVAKSRTRVEIVATEDSIAYAKENFLKYAENDSIDWSHSDKFLAGYYYNFFGDSFKISIEDLELIGEEKGMDTETISTLTKVLENDGLTLTFSGRGDSRKFTLQGGWKVEDYIFFSKQNAQSFYEKFMSIVEEENVRSRTGKRINVVLKKCSENAFATDAILLNVSEEILLDRIKEEYRKTIEELIHDKRGSLVSSDIGIS
jgi:hypothetical protein